jgi:hypothetical protein
MLVENEVELTGSLMRSHLVHYGLFGHRRSDRDVFLEGPESEAIARDVSTKYRQQHLEGRFLWSGEGFSSGRETTSKIVDLDE